MKQIIVNGGRPLGGELSVAGSKNSALPVIFACILTNGVSRIENLPDIGDVDVALRILSSFGAVITKTDEATYIDTRDLYYIDPAPSLVEMIRASTYLMGACLSRFSISRIMRFGGCNFSLRPIDMHIDACISFGARLKGDLLISDRIRGCEIEFSKASVGATVNALLLASSADGDSIIRGCAVEPHIDLLIDFLNSCGADIRRSGRDLYVRGTELHGGNIRINADMIEAGSYLALSLMCGRDIRVLGCPTHEMASVISTYDDMGAEVIEDKGELSISLKEYKPTLITAMPYPGFPTDLQPIFAPIMAKFGGGEIVDTVWEGRFVYLSSLSDFGVKSRTDGNHSYIYPSKIGCGITTATDLRGGMAALMCALHSAGQSVILSAETILRGYENLVEKLSAIGADIKIDDI